MQLALCKLPETIKEMDLSNNELNNKTTAELVAMIAAIPKTVTFINLAGNNLFSNKTPQERDALIDALAPYNTHGRLNLENNGERNIVRTASFFIDMHRQRKMHIDIANQIAPYLGCNTSSFFSPNKVYSYTRLHETIALLQI